MSEGRDIYSVVAVAGAVAVSILTPAGLAFIVPAAVASLLLIVLVLALVVPEMRDRLLAWVFASFLVHLAIGAFITHTSLVSYFGPDAQSYHQQAIEITKQWRGLPSAVTVTGGKEGFYYMLAALYRVVGPYQIAGLVVNAACAAALIPIWSSVTSRLFGPASARWVPLVLTVMPSFLIWPSQLLREGPILLLISVAAASAVALTERVRAAPIASLVLALGVLFTFRSSIALLMAGALLIGAALGLRSLFVGLSLQAIALAVMALLVVGFGFGYAGFQRATQVDLGDVEAFRSATAAESGSSIQAGDVSSLGGAITTLPIGMIRVLFGPFPWEIGLRQAPALADGLFVWVSFVPLLLGIRDGWRRRGRRLLALAVPAFLLTALLAVVLGNYGLLLRERTQMMVLLIPFVSLGLERLVSDVAGRRVGVAVIRPGGGAPSAT